MGYKAAVQILQQAEDLKARVLKKSDLLADSQLWIDQQKLQTVYHQALVLDLEYALDKKVEQDLWNIGFKSHISALQELARDKKNARRADCQALLTWCLEAASGFYLCLLQELCDVFDVDLPFRRRGNIYGQNCSNADMSGLPQTSSCLYACQYCLVHLGDIARYRNQRRQAESFYKQAILVSPTSGHPYNQLALLEASQGDKLSTVFYYIRGISVKNPFPASATNLLSTLGSSIDKESPLDKVQSKITVNEFIQIFLCTHAFLHTGTDLLQAGIGVKSLNSTMTALVATQSFTTEKLLKITAINLFNLKFLFDNNCELTEDEKICHELILDLLAGSLSAFLVPVHTLKCDESLLDYYALPAVKLLTYWIRSDPSVLKQTVFTNRLQIWPSLCKLLNNSQQYVNNFDHRKYANVPLTEDRTLQGFRPLQKSFKELNFKAEHLDDDKTEKLIRMKRLIDFGLFMAELDVNNTKLITINKTEDTINFEPGCMQPDPTDDLLEEMKIFNVSEGLGKKLSEKRGGILKPQGSLEKSREERELLTFSDPNLLSDLSNASSSSNSSPNSKEPIKVKRPKQNVALQSIFKKIEENKQVKFNVDDYDKTQNFNTKSKSNGSQFNSQRMPPYGQNQANFPVQANQDYLNSLRNMSKLESNSFKNDLTLPQQLIYQSQQTMFNNNINKAFPPPNQNFQNSFNSRILPQTYQNVPFPPNNMPQPPFNNAVNETWWPNPPQTAQNFTPNFAGFNNFMPSLPAPPPDFSKAPNQASGDAMFNSPWNSFGRTNFGDGALDGMGNNGLSMRQAMLKEANNRALNETMAQTPTSSPGYSLFNTNSWSPNLVGQLRHPKSPQNNSLSNLSQHSLFTTVGQGPQSLAQLLEQQQSQKNDL